MANLVPKTPASVWVETARIGLIEEGVDGLRVERLAQRLGVTRGGFYHHFDDRAQLLHELLLLWKRKAVFVPPGLAPTNPAAALLAIDSLVSHLIAEDAYDPRFDMAVRHWAHADKIVEAAVDRVDAQRIEALREIFEALECDAEEASIRARVLYFHQIGYYAIGVHETRASRREHVGTYIRILCGDENLERARRWTKRSQHVGAPTPNVVQVNPALRRLGGSDQ